MPLWFERIIWLHMSVLPGFKLCSCAQNTVVQSASLWGTTGTYRLGIDVTTSYKNNNGSSSRPPVTSELERGLYERKAKNGTDGKQVSGLLSTGFSRSFIHQLAPTGCTTLLLLMWLVEVLPLIDGWPSHLASIGWKSKTVSKDNFSVGSVLLL